MARPPRRPDMPLLSPFLIWRVVFVTAVLVAGVFGIFTTLLDAGEDVAVARTAAVNTLVLFEIFYLFNARCLHGSAFTGLFSRAARPAWISVAAVLVLQVGYTYAGFMQTLFGSAPLTLAQWGAATAIAATVFVLIELEKAAQRLWRRGRPV